MKPGTERRYVLIGGKVIRAGEAFLSLFVAFFSGEEIPSGLGLECA
jgi:hypothetical protein